MKNKISEEFLLDYFLSFLLDEYLQSLGHLTVSNKPTTYVPVIKNMQVADTGIHLLIIRIPGLLE
jgi:hypothetical protein